MTERLSLFLKKLKLEWPYDPTIPLLGIYSEKSVTWKDTCTPVFIAALFTIAKTWKQSKCPSMDEWIKKIWYIYTIEYNLAIKNNKIMSFAATWILSKVSQKEKDKYHMISLISKWNLKYNTNEIIYEADTDSQTWKTNLQLPKGKEKRKDKLGLVLADKNYYT